MEVGPKKTPLGHRDTGNRNAGRTLECLVLRRSTVPSPQRRTVHVGHMLLPALVYAWLECIPVASGSECGLSQRLAL